MGPEFVGKVGAKVSSWSWGLEGGIKVEGSLDQMLIWKWDAMYKWTDWIGDYISLKAVLFPYHLPQNAPLLGIPKTRESSDQAFGSFWWLMCLFCLP